MFTVEEIRSRLGQANCAAYFPVAGQKEIGRFSAESIARFARHGVRKVEIGGYPRSHYDHLDPVYLKSLDAAFRQYGVEAVSVHCPDLLRYPISNPIQRSAAIAETERAARAGYALGARLMVVHCIPGEDQEYVMRELIDRLCDLEDMRFTDENLPFDRVEDIAEFVDKVDRPNYGMTLDIGHVAVKRDPNGPGGWKNARNLLCEPGNADRIIRGCGDRLWHLHLHDFVDHDHYAPYVGSIQWEELFEALYRNCYGGWFMFESEFPDEETVLSNVASTPARFGKS